MAPGTQVPQAGNLPSALGSRGEWRRDPGLVYMALSLIPTKPQLLSKGDVSSWCHSAGPHGEPSPGRNGEEKPQATEGEQTARSPVSTVPKGPKGRHVCAHWVCVVCVRGHTGECVYGGPGEAGSRGFPPRPAEVLSPGGGGANSAQELPHRLYHLPDPDSRQMRVSPSGPNNSRCVLITGRPRQEGRVERRVGVARRNEGGSSVDKARGVPREVWARRGEG